MKYIKRLNGFDEMKNRQYYTLKIDRLKENKGTQGLRQNRQ